MTPLLAVRGLEAAYGDLKVLRGLDFTIAEGSVTTLLGANGAGKTTTLRALCGMIPRTGTIEFDGRPIARMKTEDIVRLGIAHVPEGRGTFASLTVEENLRLGNTAASNRPGNIEAELDRVFALFPLLRERRSQIAAQLSGGQQQMLAIGRALLGRPRVLLLDEPSLGLAPNLVDQVYVALARLNQDDLSILVVEQNARRAMEVTNYAYVIDGGAIVMEGPSQEIRRNEDVISHYLGQTRD